MTLQKKILVGYGIALTLIAMVLAWAIVNLVELGQASAAILRENYKSILAADNMIAALERQDSAALLALLGYPEESLMQRRENESQFLQWLGRAKDNITIEGEAERVAAIEAEFARYQETFSQLETLRAQESGQAAAFYHQTIFPAFTGVRDACLRLKEINQNTMYLASQQAERVTVRAIWSTCAIGAVAILLGLVFSLLLSRRLVEPLRQFIQTVQRIGEGRYDVQIVSDAADELGQLAHEFNAMSRKLQVYHDLNVDQLVAEKRKSEAILRSIEDGIVVVDAQLQVQDINPTAIELLDLDPGQTEGKSLTAIIADKKVLEQVRQTAKNGQPPVLGEDDILTVRQGEATRYLMFSVTPVQARSMGMLGVVLLLRDVTRLKEVDRLKSQFVMTASHELRTPLTSIGMSIELLIEGAMDRLEDRQKQLLLAAREEVQRLKALVTDLLDLSKIEAGKIQLEFARVPVRLLFEKVLAIFRAQADGQHVALSASAPDLPAARADANKITWVLTNLISNALRYVKAGGHIQLSAWRAGDLLLLAVRDDGSGIPPEYQSKIFDTFVQVEDGRETKGSGLGLAISREIVRAHGGTIWVDSAPDRGSTFTFTLPVAP